MLSTTLSTNCVDNIVGSVSGTRSSEGACRDRSRSRLMRDHGISQRQASIVSAGRGYCVAQGLRA